MGIAISTHLPPPVMIESTEIRRWVTHILCWSCGMYFSAAASSEKDHGSMNLDSNTASVPSTMPPRVATIHEIAECLTRRCTSRTCRPALRSYQERLSSSQRAELQETSMTAANDLAVRRSLEAAGVEFIDGNGGGPGVRLRKSHPQRKRK